MNKKGFINIIIIGVIVLITAAAGYFVLTRKTAEAPATTQEKEITGDLATKDWKTYRNEEYGFEVRHPLGWENINYSDDPISRIVSFREKVYLGFTVYIFQDPENQILEQFLENYYASQINFEGPAVRVLSSKVTTVAGLAAIQNKEIWHAPNLEIMATYLKKGNVVYSFKREFLPSENQEIYNQILSTFKFIE